MKEVIISENVTSIVDAKKIIDDISVINHKYEESKKEAISLIGNIDKTSEKIKKVKDDPSYKKKLFGPSKEDLLTLIFEENNAMHSSISSISKLIQNNNDNSKLLAKMISKLAMLSGLSFEKISETTAELEEIANNLEQTSGGNTKQAGQLKQVILSQINKIKEEKNKADKIEFNFGVINDNLKELEEKFNMINLENEKKIILIQELLNSKSEEHFIKIQNRQGKLINYLGVSILITFLILFTFLIYFFYYI